MSLEFTAQADIPEGMESDFEEFEKGGSKVWIPSTTAEALRSQFRLQGNVTSLTKSQETLKSQMTELSNQKSQQEKSLADEKEALRLQGLSESDRTKEKLADFDKRLAEKETEYNSNLAALTAKAQKAELDAILSDMSALATQKDQRTLTRVMKGDLERNEDGSFTVLDDDGKATSLTLKEYKESLPERYPGLIKGTVTTRGAGLAEGSSDTNSQSKTMKRSDFEQIKSTAQMKFIKDGGKVI